MGHPVFARLYERMAPSLDRAGGAAHRDELRFYEHVRSEDPGQARLQDRVDWIWSHVLGGFHPNRDTVGAIEAAGFSIGACHRFEFGPCALSAPSSPHVIGRAVMTS